MRCGGISSRARQESPACGYANGRATLRASLRPVPARAGCGTLAIASGTGESITITKHGKPIAQLNPYRPPPAESLIGLHKGRITISGDLIEMPLDGSIAVRALDLTGLHDDPADRFIAAAAIIHGAGLMTADQRLLEWNHALERQDARQ